MKIIYIAGPFRASTQWGIAENIRAAERIGLLVAQAGAMPLIPHANTAHFHGQLYDGFWIDGTKELLLRSDAAVFIERWTFSAGSVGEMEACKRWRIPFLDLEKRSFVEPFNEINLFVKRLKNGQEDQPKEHRTAPSPASDGAEGASGDPSARHNPSR